MKVRLLSQEQKEILIGQQFAPNSYFNPIQDINDNWIISEEEVKYCINQEFKWIKDLPSIEYLPIITNDLI
jgi:hypothetical protein